jgi:hypothetical protein
LILFLTFYIFRHGVKHLVLSVARIFAPGIEERILKVSWALIWNFKDMAVKLNAARLLLTSLLMWALYLISYGLFAACVGGSGGWQEVFTGLFAGDAPAASLIQMSLSGENIVSSLLMTAFMLLPAGMLLAISFAIREKQPEADTCVRLFVHLDGSERLRFLENYFLDKNREYLDVYLKINQGISIIRDYSAGSRATTMLCSDGRSVFYRKYAFGEDGEKLYDQVKWIRDHTPALKLPDIAACEKGDIYCYYDMSLKGGTCGMFEYVHSMPVDAARDMLERALKSLETQLYSRGSRRAGEDEIRGYIEKKVTANLEKVKNSKLLRPIMGYDEVIINGRVCKNLSFYDKFLDGEKLFHIFSGNLCSDIHGDLTLENIICSRDESGKDDYYLIDPNGGNILETPDLDYAKLLQSLHGGYEFYMAAGSAHMEKNTISFMYTGSYVYSALYDWLKKRFESIFDKDRIMSIYFHEIVHWLRLMPYKLDRGEQGILFYAGLLTVLSDVYDMYGD